jgi:hypothetical protein
VLLVDMWTTCFMISCLQELSSLVAISARCLMIIIEVSRNYSDWRIYDPDFDNNWSRNHVQTGGYMSAMFISNWALGSIFRVVGI